MNWSWLDLAFPWIGLAGAVVMLVMLFGTDVLRGDPTLPRWHDRVWLSWIAMVAYLIHNFEEYGLDLRGFSHSFPDALCGTMKLPAYPDCPIPPNFYLAVNIALFWVVAPLAALLSRHHPIVGLTLYSVVFSNSLVHLAPAALSMSYNPGLLTAIVVFLPLSIWVGYVCFGNGRMSYKVMALLVFDGVLLHAILMGSASMFINGMIGNTAFVAAQILNASLLLLIPWLAEKWHGGVLAQPVQANARF